MCNVLRTYQLPYYVQDFFQNILWKNNLCISGFAQTKCENYCEHTTFFFTEEERLGGCVLPEGLEVAEEVGVKAC
jgi:hypothetical protein